MKFRFKAFFIHLLISLVIAVGSLILVFFIWHPNPLAKAVGVGQIFLMMLMIDVLLGPMLTFCIANPNKKSLKFDFLVIVVIQFAALIYGLHSIYINRPVYIVFDTKRFELIQASDIPSGELSQAKVDYSNLGLFFPKYAAVIPPKDAQEKSGRLFYELQNGVAPSMRPSLYQALNKQNDLISRSSHKISELYLFNSKDVVDEQLSENSRANAWLPLLAYSNEMVVLINKEKGEVVKIVDLRPWN